MNSRPYYYTLEVICHTCGSIVIKDPVFKSWLCIKCKKLVKITDHYMHDPVRSSSMLRICI